MSVAGLLPATSPAAVGAAPLQLHLEVTTGRKAPLPAPASSAAALAVLNSMSDERRAQLTLALHNLAVTVAVRKNPFYVRLDDSEERKAVADLIAKTAPAFTAATALLGGQWQSPEGDVWVRPVSRCAAEGRCVALQGKPGDSAEEKRAHFLAWPLGYAIILQTAEGENPDEVAEALRAPGLLHIALVLTGAELHTLRPSPALSQLQREAGRAVSALPREKTPLFETLASLAKVRSGKNPMAWLRLPPRTILIVPRLSALATIEQLVEDVGTRLGANTKVEWLVTPR